MGGLFLFVKTQGAVLPFAQRGSEDVSCHDCGTIYNLLIAYREALEADTKEKGVTGYAVTP